MCGKGVYVCTCMHMSVCVNRCSHMYVWVWGWVRRQPYLLSPRSCPLDFMRRVLQCDIRLSDSKSCWTMNPGELSALSPPHWIAMHLPQYPAFHMGAGDLTQGFISESRPSTFKPEPTPWFLKHFQWMSGHEPLCVNKILTVSPHHTTAAKV